MSNERGGPKVKPLDRNALAMMGRLPTNPSEGTELISAKCVPFERGDHVEIAERVIHFLRDSHEMVVGDESRIHQYDSRRGVFIPIDPVVLSRTVQAFAGSPIDGQKRPLSIKASDVTGAIRLAYDRVAEPGFFADALPGLAFANGFVHVKPEGVECVPHSPDNRARFSYGFNYEGNRPPIAFLRFMHSLFRDDEDREEKIMCVQEHLGVSLVGQAARYQRSSVYIGGGGNGKNALIDVVSAAFPPGSVEAIAPQDWGQEYRRAMLAGKLLNVVSELPEADIIASESFKAIITGDPIVGRHIRDAPFTFRPKAGHVFAANRLPGTNDQTEGFWRRLIVIKFNRDFESDPEKDPEIASKIVSSELPLVVAWMLEGASRLMRECKYTMPASHAEHLAEWRASADQIRMFIDERREEAPNGYGTQASVVYDAYRKWADSNGHRAVSSTKFGLRMKEIGLESIKTRTANFYPVRVVGLAGSSQPIPQRESAGKSNACN